jgi:hypothetical protein
MVVQFFGLDVVNRNKMSKQFAGETNSFYCTDRELPMASLEAQFARWLRTIAGVFQRNGVKDIVMSGYFPTEEAREQFKNGNLIGNVITVWVDTIDPSDAKEPEGPQATTDFRWESPNESEYDYKITSLDQVKQILDEVKARLV